MKKFLSKFKNQFYTDQKDKNLVNNISGAFLIKGLSLILSVFTMPAYMNFFEDQAVLGVWFTLLSVMSWIFTFDVGIGNGLRNCLTKALVDKDQEGAKRYISSSYLLITVLAAVVLGIGIVVFPLLNWNKIFNIDAQIIDPATILLAVQIIFGGMIVQFVLKLISSVLYAMQKSAINNLIALVVAFLQLMLILLLPDRGVSQNLISLSWWYSLLSNLPYVVVTIVVFCTRPLKGCGISLRYFNKNSAKATLNLGLMFLWAQILHMLINLTNDFMITQFTSPVFEVDYSIYYRLFSLVSTVFTLALTPLWSAVTRAQQERDHAWLNKTYKLVNRLVYIGIAGNFLLIPILQLIINIWLGDNAIQVNYWYALIFACFGSVFTVQSAQAMFACGFGRMRLQCICYSIGVVIKFAMVYFGTQVWPEGWILVVLANFIVILPYCLLQPKYIRQEINALKEPVQT